MRQLHAVMGEHATPASLQIGDLLLSWDKGERELAAELLPLPDCVLPMARASIQLGHQMR